MIERPLAPQNRLYRGFRLLDDCADYEPRNPIDMTPAEQKCLQRLVIRMAILAAWVTALVAIVSFTVGVVIGHWGRA